MQSASQEDFSTMEPIRRFSVAMTTNEAFLGAKHVNPLDFQEFNRNSITVYRNVYPVAGTPLVTENDKEIYPNSLEALVFGQHGLGVLYNDYTNHSILMLDLTNT